jgi:hypothetical protein
MKLRANDRGQAYTMEGVVAGLILVLTLMYITSSISFVAPQTEKSNVVKLEIKATDILNVLGENMTADNHDQLTNDIALWGGKSIYDQEHVNASEPSVNDLNRTIWQMLNNGQEMGSLFFNVYVTYETSPGNYVTTPIIMNGDTQNDDTRPSMIKLDVASASKIVVVDQSYTKSSKWIEVAAASGGFPKAVEVKLEIWTL